MEDHKDNRIFFLNTTGISLVEFFWGLGLPLVLESTFLQLFLNKLGASNQIISLVPTVLFIGQAFMGIIGAYQSRRLSNTRTLVIIYHLYPSVVVMTFGFYLLISGSFLPSTITVFFIVYIIFNTGIGMVVPVWMNYLIKLFDSHRVLPALSIMMIAQSAGKLISSFLIAGYFVKNDITARSSSILFIFCGLLFFIGSFAFLITREPCASEPVSVKKLSLPKYLAGSLKEILKNKNILFFIMSDIETYAVIAVISFYANYAVDFHGVSAAVAAGVFVGLNYSGQIAANILFGTLNLFSIKTKCILSRLCSISGILILLFGTGLSIFLVSSILLGSSRAIRGLVYAPAVKILSGRTDVTGLFAAAPILMLPLSAGIPLLCGRLLDSLPFYLADSYRIVFAFLGLLSFISIFFIMRINFGSSLPSIGTKS